MNCLKFLKTRVELDLASFGDISGRTKMKNEINTIGQEFLTCKLKHLKTEKFN